MNCGLKSVGENLTGNAGNVRLHAQLVGHEFFRATGGVDRAIAPMSEALHEGVSFKAGFQLALLAGRHKENVFNGAGAAHNVADLDETRTAIIPHHLEHRSTIGQWVPCFHTIAVNTAIDIHVLLPHLGEGQALDIAHGIGQTMSLILEDGGHPNRRQGHESHKRHRTHAIKLGLAGGHHGPEIIVARLAGHLGNRRLAKTLGRVSRSHLGVGQFDNAQQPITQLAVTLLDEVGKFMTAALVEDPIVQPEPSKISRGTRRRAEEQQSHRHGCLGGQISHEKDEVRQEQSEGHAAGGEKGVNPPELTLEAGELGAQSDREFLGKLSVFLHGISLVFQLHFRRRTSVWR